MKRLLFIAAIALASCNTETPSTETTDTRMPIEVQYVRDATLKIHTKAADDAPVVTTYQHGESVSILSRSGAWAEVRIASGSGWVHANELATAAEASKAEEDNLKPHFTRDPQPVTQPGAHGEIVLEADVNTDGVVTNVRTLKNTTGSTSLETNNANSLRQAVFTPVVRHGRREAFVYEHRVHY
ncbi:MAG TPA: SH3 domain-containing protein [Thermoanaerobaculia bacterium]|jgi:uncharacterized protein YgiM (DUF1202 family)|nr:SH3 domain-containing protein [Thermoanaerobaculia bacterium]